MDFTQGIRLVDSTGVLIAHKGTYFEEQDSALFIQHVQLLTDEEYAESDSMTLARKSKRSYLSGNVLIDNLTEQQRIRADSIYADSSGFRQLIGNAIIRTIDLSLSMILLDNPTPNSPQFRFWIPPLSLPHSLIFMIGIVLRSAVILPLAKSWSTNFSTHSDSLQYESEFEQFILTGEPVAWYDNTELNAQTIIAQTDSSELSMLYLFNDAFVTVREETSGRFNQLKRILSSLNLLTEAFIP